MPIYSIADIRVEIINQYDHLTRQCKEYASEQQGAPADLTIRVTEAALQQERLLAGRPCAEGYLESLCAQRALCLQLPRFEGMLLHGSVIACGEQGIAFLAPSGVGKTTHTKLWQERYPITVVNGDKPILRFFDGVPYAYGTPWAGKEGFQTNTRVALTDLCFIERSAVNEATPIKKAEAVPLLMRQLLIPTEEEGAKKTLELTSKLLDCCRVWKIRCNMSPEAAETAHRAIVEAKSK